MAPELKYCPRCGALGLELAGSKRLGCAQCRFELFLNVAAAVAALIENGERLLVTTRRYPPEAGTLDLPGGFVDPGESAEAALRREIQEELHLEILTADYFCSWPNRYRYGGMEYCTLDLAFICRIADLSTLRPADDVSACRWIPARQLSPRQFGLQGIRTIVARYKNKYAF